MPSRQNILDRLQGSEIHIPDLHPVFDNWVQVAINPRYHALTSVCDSRLQSIFTNPHSLAALKASDFALFAATWWPRASFSRLVILLYFIIWLFNWDDEVDEPSGSYAADISAAERYRARTEKFLRGSLGLGGAWRSVGDRPGDVIITSFADVGVVIAMQEFALNIRISDVVMRKDKHVKVITDEMIVNICIVNDLLSLKKEMSKGCIDSLVPIYCSQGLSVQGAVNEAVHTLKVSKHRFDFAAKSLMASARKEPCKYQHVSEWVEGCQSLCVGNLV